MKKISKHTIAVVAAGVFALCANVAQAGKLGVFTSDAGGFDTHTFYYDDGKEVTLIDTQFVPELTKAMVEKVKSETASPITRVIVTHPNPDKFNGLAYLHSLGIESIGNEATSKALPGVNEYKKYFFVNVAKMFTNETYPKFENVKTTFTGEKTIKLRSGETLSLIELKNPGVTSTQVVVRIDQTGDLVVGDLVSHNAHAWLEGAIVNGKPQANLVKWQAALDELPALSKGKPDAKVYGGRGDFVPVARAVEDERTYLSKADALVDGYIAKVGDPKALTDPATSGKHHEELEKQFAAAFPGYTLSYMIKYSVYGLIASKL